MAIWCENCAHRWCAQAAPGGRPSIGPVPPPSRGSTGCCVVLAAAWGAGFSVEPVFRRSTSKRGMAAENAGTPKVGLGDIPVGTSNPKQPLLKLVVWAWALRTNGLKPPMGANTPAVVNRPMRTSSRREILPCDKAFTISARFLRAFSAFLSLALSLFSERQNRSLQLLPMVALLGYC